ncbi:MAG: elongation factor P [Phycisphaerae bacterium]|jgi:elongation factor P
MSIKAIDLRRGVAVEYNNKLYVVHDFAKVSKGNWRSFMQVKLKDTQTGSIIEQRFRVDDTLEQAFLDQKPMEYLYSDTTTHYFMDLTDFEQLELSGDVVGEAVKYLKPNTQVQITMYQGKPFSVELPNTVELEITDCPPSIKGATVSNVGKDATLETGMILNVPDFISQGTVVRVDTRTGEYLGRVND